MKTQEITTGKATILVVEIKEPNFLNICNIGSGEVDYAIGLGDGTFIPIGNNNQVEYIGTANEITEEQAITIVDEYIYNTGEAYGYYNYEIDCQTDCPIESLNNLLTANGVVFENPLGYEPKITSGEYDDNGFGDIDKYQFKKDLKSWQKAQSKVWDKERTYLFIKVD